jgi:hypothetical protein
LLDDMDAILKAEQRPGPVMQVLRARRDIGLGRGEAGCETVKALAAPSSGLPGRLKGEAQLLAGFCAAAANDAHAAGLAGGLAREEGVDAQVPLDVLAALAAGDKPKLALPKRILLLDYRFLELLGSVDDLQVLGNAEPALVVMLAGKMQGGARLQLAAAEAALGLNALSAKVMAQIYRQATAGARLGEASAQANDPAMRRALFYQAAAVAPTPQQAVRYVQAFVEDSRSRDSFVHLAPLVASLLADWRPRSPAFRAFAPTAVEIALTAGDFMRARRWAEAAGMWSWLALVDIGDPERRGGRLQSLAGVEDLLRHGRASPETLHRLATSLDVLDIDVPISIWDAAGRTPQPAGGYLPETGVLAELAEAAGRNEAGRAILLAMRALGPGGPAGAHVLALGEAIRALRRVGLEADARRVALEALLPVWPRSGS